MSLVSILLLILICAILAPCQAWLTASDGYNIGIFMGSILGGVLLILVLFFVLYYCWLRQVLFDYTEYRRQYSVGSGVGGRGGPQQQAYYKKKPPPPDYTSRAGTYEVRAPSPILTSRPMITSVSGGLAPRSASPYGGGGVMTQQRDESPQRTSSYTRTTTVQRGASPSPTRAHHHSPVQLSRGPTPSQLRDDSPGRRVYLDSSAESRHSPPGAGGYQPVLATLNRPDSQLSSHSRVMVNQEPSLSYQSNFQQRVVTASSTNTNIKSQRPAYAGSSV